MAPPFPAESGRTTTECLFDAFLRAHEELRSSLLELFRHIEPHLMALGQQDIDTGLQARCGASDIRQDALLNLLKNPSSLAQLGAGSPEKDILAFFHAVYRNALRDERREQQGAGRDYRAEVGLEGAAGTPAG